MSPGLGALRCTSSWGRRSSAPGPRQAQALTDALMDRIARLSGF